MVWAGTPVTVVVAPLLKRRMSLVAGVVRVGVQFVAVAYEAVPVWFQTYVVCANALEPNTAIQNVAAKRKPALLINPPLVLRVVWHVEIAVRVGAGRAASGARCWCLCPRRAAAWIACPRGVRHLECGGE